MAPICFNQTYSDAWKILGLNDRRSPTDIFPRSPKKDFDELKAKYHDKHGYVIKIPEVSDIIHIKPNAFKSAAEIKAEKRKGLNQILASPSPDWARKFSTAMTFIDDIQDTTSVIYPAISMLTRVAPKIMKRILPVLGWMMLGGDLLNLLIGIGRLPVAGMAGKRLNCDVIKHNPFTKKARFDRTERLRNYKPGLADLIQVAQTTDNIIGVGLSLGPLMGFMQDAIFGAYKYVTGERVRISHEVPPMFEHESAGRRAMQSSALINTRGQEFSEETHFWSLTMGALGGALFLPYAHDADLSIAVEDPMSIMIPAPYPTNPITLEVIRDAGLDPARGYGWPINGSPEISLSDLTDYLVEHTQASIGSYWRRHDKGWYGFVTALCWGQILPMAIKAFDPGMEVEYEDSEIARVGFSMLKAPLIPTRFLTIEEKREFFSWVMMISEFTGRPPGVMAIREKLTSMGIPYRESYPTTREPEADLLFDKDLNLSLYSLY